MDDTDAAQAPEFPGPDPPLPYRWMLDGDEVTIKAEALHATFRGPWSEDGQTFSGGWRPDPGHENDPSNVAYDVSGGRKPDDGGAVPAEGVTPVATEFTADEFIERLERLRPPDRSEAEEARAPESGPTDIYIGVRMGDVFALAKECMNMAQAEIEALLVSPIHEVRVGAVSIMDWQARSRKTSAERRRELFDLYIRRHDRINTWDLVDRSASFVVGDYLRDKPRDILYTLARSERPMERRTAIVSCHAFIRHGDLDDTFRIAQLLLRDDQDLVHKAVGWMLREAGKRDEARLRRFLDAHAASMPRVMLRYSIEKLDIDTRGRYLASRSGRPPG